MLVGDLGFNSSIANLKDEKLDWLHVVTNLDFGNNCMPNLVRNLKIIDKLLQMLGICENCLSTCNIIVVRCYIIFCDFAEQNWG